MPSTDPKPRVSFEQKAYNVSLAGDDHSVESQHNESALSAFLLRGFNQSKE
jgi:hypothetical protein